MKVKPILAENEVSGSGRITLCILGILGNIKGNLNSTTSAGKIYYALFPIQCKGMQVVARRATYGLRTTWFAPLLLSGNRRLNRFGSLLSGLNMQVRNEIGESIFTSTVGEVVKRVGITLMLFPASPANDIKRFSKLTHRVMKRANLFCRWLEKYPQRSIHTDVIPYIKKILQYKELNRNSSVA